MGLLGQLLTGEMAAPPLAVMAADCWPIQPPKLPSPGSPRWLSQMRWAAAAEAVTRSAESFSLSRLMKAFKGSTV